MDAGPQQQKRLGRFPGCLGGGNNRDKEHVLEVYVDQAVKHVKLTCKQYVPRPVVSILTLSGFQGLSNTNRVLHVDWGSHSCHFPLQPPMCPKRPVLRIKTLYRKGRKGLQFGDSFPLP